MGKRLQSNEPVMPGEVCPICSGIGLIEISRGEWGHCECARRKAAWLRIKNSGLEEEVKEKRFDNFGTEYTWQTKLLAAGKNYAQSIIDGGEGWFIALGQPGGGKTHICTAISGELMNAGIRLVYVTWKTLILKAKKRFSEEFGDENTEFFEELTKVPVLYIDDLFKGEPSRPDMSIAFELLNERMIRKLPTIISSEMSVDWMIDKDEATGSRIVEMARRNGRLFEIPRNTEWNYRLREDD